MIGCVNLPVKRLDEFWCGSDFSKRRFARVHRDTLARADLANSVQIDFWRPETLLRLCKAAPHPVQIDDVGRTSCGAIV